MEVPSSKAASLTHSATGLLLEMGLTATDHIHEADQKASQDKELNSFGYSVKAFNGLKWWTFGNLTAVRSSSNHSPFHIYIKENPVKHPLPANFIASNEMRYLGARIQPGNQNCKLITIRPFKLEQQQEITVIGNGVGCNWHLYLWRKGSGRQEKGFGCVLGA